jgi:prevent-host-death family protein
MSATLNLYDAKTHLSELVDRAAGGEEIVIAKAGKPKARLVPMEGAPRTPRQPGCWKGRIEIAPDFDAPLPDDVLAYFEGEGEDGGEPEASPTPHKTARP